MESEGGELVLENKSGLTVCVSSETYKSVEITGCTKCFIYIMRPMGAVHVRHCTECTVFVCQTDVASVSFCQDCIITEYVGKIQISKSQSVDLYLFTGSPPIISEGSFKIRLAPYNAVVRSIVPSGLNLWNQPVLQSGATFSLLDPPDFLPLVVPFGDEPEGILAPLPPAYRKALAWREQVAEERRQLVLEFCRKVPSFAGSLQERISSAFKQHLASTRDGEQLKQLQSVEFL